MHTRSLFTLILCFALSSLYAQKNSIALSTGPSGIYYWTNDFEQEVFKTPIGYAFGLDFSRKISKKWQVKLGARYGVWKIPKLSGPLQWPSEFDGNIGYLYDPKLVHFLAQGYSGQSAFQVISGLSWRSTQADFYWVATGEVGLSGFTKEAAGEKANLYPTLGLSYGAAYTLSGNWSLFATPGVRFIIRDFDRKNTPDRHLLNVQLEMGARYTF